MSITVSTLYCNDEDIAVRSPGDFAVLCPNDQKIVAGIDGVIATGSWVLTSPTIPDWTTFGLTPGMVLQLKSSGSQMKPIKELLVVDSVASGGLTLRRKASASGVGQPPGGVAGLTGIEFLVTTFGPQITIVSYEMNRRYGIDDLIVGRRTSDMYDRNEVNQACAIDVLCRQCFSEARRAGTMDDSLFAKGKAFKEELRELLDRVVVHWLPVTNTASGMSLDVSTRFSTRISR